MSAINGIFERREPVSPNAFLTVSLEALSGYGRDGSSRWISTFVGLGHQRTLLFHHNQTETLPYHDAGSGLVITTDARLDNRPELFERLGIKETERKGLSDSRLILRAWEKWGHDCPDHLIGDYTFAIWDERQKILFCARDHIGARAFYYCLTPERFIFASDIKGVLAVPGVSDELDEEYVIAALADKNFYRKDRTYLSGVKILPPGHTLLIEPESFKIKQFWFPKNAGNIRFAKDSDYSEAAMEIYTRAISDRLQTTEKVGVHLSGGLDSSSVTVLTTRERRRQGLTPPEVFSWQPPPDSADTTLFSLEHQQITAVCNQEGLIPQYCPANTSDILAILKKDPTHEPIHDTLAIETTSQRQAAAAGVRLLLSGWGGDESLSYNGRGLYAQMLLRGHWRHLFREARKYRSPLKFIALEAILLLFPDRTEGEKKIATRSLKYGAKCASFIHPELLHRIRLHKIPCRHTSIRSTLFWLWERGCLAERMESWAAHGAPLGLTYAYPLLDRRLLEFVAGLPPEQFVRGKWRRWMMRSAMEGILPAEICWQPDKDEPIRTEQTLTAIFQALDMARRQINARDSSPSRAPYLDMNKLMERLQPESLAQRPRQADMRRALQFLDF